VIFETVRADMTGNPLEQDVPLVFNKTRPWLGCKDSEDPMIVLLYRSLYEPDGSVAL
jgi:hypothetical protein